MSTPNVIPFPRPICHCPEHSEYLWADIDGFHCDHCRGRVPRDATNQPKGMTE